MTKYFEWNYAGTIKILDALPLNRRYRILAAPMSCNAGTVKAILHEGASEPVSGDMSVIDFVDGSRLHNAAELIAPYESASGNPIFLTARGQTQGRGAIIYIEECVRSK